MSEFTSHYQDLLKDVSLKDQAYNKGIVVATIPPLMERKDGSSVFDEGEVFSGAETKGSAEAYITATASPHIRPSLPRELFIDAAEQVLERKVQLPEGMSAVEYMSPQAIIWWRDTECDEESADLLRLSRLSSDRQDEFCDVIKRQTIKAARIVQAAASKPVIWGSWGYATPEERQTSGRGRGVPTNGHGHLHVIDFTSEIPLNALDSTVSSFEKLNHYKLWSSVLHEGFSEPIARAMRLSVDGLSNTDIAPFSEVVDSNDTTGIINNGYVITFNKPKSYATVFKTLIGTAGMFEDFYKKTADNHAVYYMYQFNPDISAQARLEIVANAQRVGFAESEAKQFADFTLGIRPTYAQICTWLTDLEEKQESPEDIARLNLKKELYDRIRNRLGEIGTNNSMGNSLIRGTVAHPSEYKSVGGVWPEHAAATFIIEDYDFDEHDNLLVNKVKIILGIDSTQSAPEHMTGRILRRSAGSA